MPRPVTGCSPRMEYLLSEAPASKVLETIKLEHPDLSFTPHPTSNGLSHFVILMRVKVDRDKAWEVREQLRRAFPDTIFEMDLDGPDIVMKGAPADVDGALEMVAASEPARTFAMTCYTLAELSPAGLESLNLYALEGTPQASETIREYVNGTEMAARTAPSELKLGYGGGACARPQGFFYPPREMTRCMKGLLTK